MRLFSARGCTDIKVSDLAEEAGVARGTIYSHVASIEDLFSDIAARKSEEMSLRVERRLSDVNDAARRIAFGIRWYIQAAHEDPEWCRFVTRFAFSAESLQHVLSGRPSQEISAGQSQGRFELKADQLQAAVTLAASSVIAAMVLVREGHATWRDAGGQCAFLVLRALGLDCAEAQSIAGEPLPQLSFTSL